MCPQQWCFCQAAMTPGAMHVSRLHQQVSCMRAARAVDAQHSSDLQGQEEGMHLLQLTPQQVHLRLEGPGCDLQTGITSKDA